MHLKHYCSVVLTAILLVSATEAQEREASPTQNRGTRAAFKLPGGVKVVRDIVCAKYGDREVQLDLYLPKNTPSKPMAAAVVIHGGGGHAFWNSQQWFGDVMSQAAEFFDKTLNSADATNGK